MDSKSLYSLKIFERVGTPLINAVMRKGYKDGTPVSSDDAKQISALLKASIEMSDTLASTLKGEEDDKDALKIAIISMTAPMVAEYFARTGDIPDADNSKTLQSFLQEVLNASDRFAEAKDAANRRLRLADPDPISVSSRLLFDDTQMQLQAMQSMLPVVIRISEFDFGHDPKTLIEQVSKKLQSRSKLLAKSLYGKQEPSDQRLSELAVIRALAHIYASCHNAEKRRIENMDDAKREKLGGEKGKFPLEPLWQMFELRTGLMMTLSKSLVDTPKAEKAKDTPEEKGKGKIPDARPDQGQSERSDANPMAFFGKGETSPTPKDTAANTDTQDEEEDEGQQGGSGGSKGQKAPSQSAPEQTNANPMSFFSKGR